MYPWPAETDNAACFSRGYTAGKAYAASPAWWCGYFWGYAVGSWGKFFKGLRRSSV